MLLALACLVRLAGAAPGTAAATAEPHAVYLVRHAEKDLEGGDARDPGLLPCGIRRAQHLADMLAGIELGAVYSTDFRRTRLTAEPSLGSRQLTLQLYDPRDLDELAQRLLSRQEDALVVGHSNTTSVLAGKLAGLELGELGEHEYDRLYQVVISPGAVKLQLLYQAFPCGN